MREIKFRAWDASEGKFVQPKDWIGYFDDLSFGDLKEILNDSALQFQQFTGVKDHKGVEMYEGDIVKVSDFQDDAESKKYLIKYFGDELYPAFDLEGYDAETNGISEALNALYIEVIGNVWENPSLLK